MNVNIPLTPTDAIVLIVLLFLCGFGVRALIGFFKDPDRKRYETPKATEGTDKFAAGSKVVLTIGGMQCGMCESHVKDAIREAIPEAGKLYASHIKGEARFILPDETTRENLETLLHNSIDPTGYELEYLAVK